jgi:amidase
MSSRFSTTAASALAGMIRDGETTSEEVVAACLGRALSREGDLRAWAHLDAEAALAQARERDRAPPLGPLHGVPVAVKDLTDTADAPTGYGSPIYAGHRPRADAPPVALLREAGAVVLGKTVTVEFAASEPGPTRNPHDRGRTPGGSSSGSAAAVADGQVPLATGTQTGGSVVRPAAYCGVVGLKPSFGDIAVCGTKCASWSLDTFGLFARDVADAHLFRSVLNGSWAGPGGGAAPTPGRADPPRIGVVWDLAEEAEASALDALDRASAALARRGAAVREARLPLDLRRVVAAQRVIARYETARSLAHERLRERAALSPRLAAELEEGLAIPGSRYRDALRFAAEARAAVAAVFADLDALATFAAAGEAPLGLGSTGSATFGAAWTLLHLPAIALPAGRGPAGMPLSVQMVGPFLGDEALLDAAAWAEPALAG